MGKVQLSSLPITSEFPFWPSHWAGQHKIPVRSYTTGHDAKALGKYFWLSQGMFSILCSLCHEKGRNPGENVEGPVWICIIAGGHSSLCLYLGRSLVSLTEKWVASLLLPDSISFPNILLFFPVWYRILFFVRHQYLCPCQAPSVTFSLS